MKKLLVLIVTIVALVLISACTSTSTNNEGVNSDTSYEETTNDAEWKVFLKEYEEWIDSYIELLKKRSENPQDLSILSEYSKMIQELGEWSEKTEAVKKELETASPTDVAEYSKELIRIAGKITDALKDN